MKTRALTADSLSAQALRLLYALNLLFFFAFVATVIALGSKARASDLPACTGKDLVAEMATGDTARLKEIREKAAAVANGSGLLWKIEKDGAKPSWLFGTMHLTDDRVITLPTAAQDAFESAGTVVLEAIDALDQAKASATLLGRPELIMFTDGRTLSSLIPKADRAMVEKALEERGMPLVAVNAMKPWVVSSAIALPACEMARKKAHMPFLDMKLAQEAEASGKQLAGLETMASQLEMMNSLPAELHVAGLVDTLALGDTLDDMIETMIILYTKGETGMIWPLLEAVSPNKPGAAEGYAEFEQIMVTKRNHGMAENAVPFLDKGNAFIAVGALHLPGAEGLIELLRARGYKVSPAG
ncbi:MAG: TraB/GumN family protein [Notoacmeibacter sp.]|nr:TraB/GumN family protein [Notoacmeibacter sp.]